MLPERPQYKTKAECAAAQARGIRKFAALIRLDPTPTDPEAERRKFGIMSAAHAEARRWERVAERFRRQGV